MVRDLSTRALAIVGAAAVLTAGAACNREEAAPPATATSTSTPAQTSEQPNDSSIITNVQSRYYSDDMVRGRNVSVAAENGVVTLSGTVESEEARQRAVSLAREAQGVRDVRDDLTVRTASAQTGSEPGPRTDAQGATGTSGTTGGGVEPAWITTKIQAQYFINPEVKPWNIDVTTNSGGVVTLEGQVDAAEDRTEAVRIARETEGVTRVDDRLRVKGEPDRDANAPKVDRPDVWLTAKVQSKYFLDDVVKGRDIDVDTQNGTVTLTGTVASDSERRQAVALARNTEGVREVKDELKVDAKAVDADGERAGMQPVPALKRPDAWITMKVQSQFFLDNEVKGRDIDVDTTRGVVLLKGAVETAEQKQQAERIARETEGVTRVINQLTVGAVRQQ